MLRNLRLFLAGLAMVGVLFTIGCTQDNNDVNLPNAKPGDQSSSGADSQQAENSRITLSVRQEFDKDATLSPFKIEVQVADGIVSLRGRVPTQQAADRAQQLAQQVDGVRTVRSFLKVGDDEQSS
jgi:osmotically-inducible protein OsmY